VSRPRREDAPRPPWHPVPLTELCLLVGIIVLLVGLFGSGSRGLLIAFGLALVSAATVELTLREHLAGHRSHSLLLAGVAAAVIAAPVAALAHPAKAVVLLMAAVVFAVAFAGLRAVFRRRSGGAGWRA
jgi:hypothetical protein